MENRQASVTVVWWLLSLKVKLTYERAIELGAQCEGPPGLRGKNFFGAYFRDLDGNKLNFHCQV